ncbi:MAG: B12-binding domain-containing radical SAM protein [Thermosulfidibacteraceae bacterium]
MISRKLLDYWGRIKSEEVSDVTVSRNYDLLILLVYPNVYSLGISSLAVHRVFEILNSFEGVSCDLFFLPDSESVIDEISSGYECVSYYLEKTPPEFDLILFSISYENDLINVVKIFKYFKIPLLAEDRGEEFPPVIAGGIAVTENPEPYAPIFDVLCLGDSEGLLDIIIEEYFNSDSKVEYLKKLNLHESIYVPSFYRTEKFGNFQVPIISDKKLRKNVYPKFSEDPAKSVIHTGLAVFGKTKIIEISRGCPRKCKFCLASWLHGKTRFIEFSTFERLLEETSLEKVGLLGTSISDWPHLVEALDRYPSKRFSFSSLRLDTKREVFERMARIGVRTVTFGVEAFSEQLRRRIGKPYKDDFIMDVISFVSGKFEVLKLYFMIGLPGESDDDILCAKDFLNNIREVFSGRISINLSPFVPKPHTPFEFEAFMSMDLIRKRINIIRNIVKPIKEVSLSWDLPKYAKLETIISRGDRSIGYWIAGKARITESIYLSPLNPNLPYPWKIVV